MILKIVDTEKPSTCHVCGEMKHRLQGTEICLNFNVNHDFSPMSLSTPTPSEVQFRAKTGDENHE